MCVFSSMESGIHFGEFEEAARAIHNYIRTSLQHLDQMMPIHDLVKPKAVSGLTVMTCYGTGGADPMNHDGWSYPTNVQLIGTNSGVAHTVTLVK